LETKTVPLSPSRSVRALATPAANTSILKPAFTFNLSSGSLSAGVGNGGGGMGASLGSAIGVGWTWVHGGCGFGARWAFSSKAAVAARTTPRPIQGARFGTEMQLLCMMSVSPAFMVLAAAPILVPAPCDNLREARGHCQGQTGLPTSKWQRREAGLR